MVQWLALSLRSKEVFTVVSHSPLTPDCEWFSVWPCKWLATCSGCTLPLAWRRLQPLSDPALSGRRWMDVWMVIITVHAFSSRLTLYAWVYPGFRRKITVIPLLCLSGPFFTLFEPCYKHDVGNQMGAASSSWLLLKRLYIFILFNSCLLFVFLSDHFTVELIEI